MIRFVYVFLLTGCFLLPELLLRNFGLFFPFCALFVFYTATAFGLGWGVLSACLAALGLDTVGGGSAHPWSILVLISVAYLAVLWLKRAESDSILMNFLPGLIIPVQVWFLSLIFFPEHGFTVLIEQFPTLIPAAAASAVWLPCMIYLLDNLNEKLALPLFTDAKLKQKLKL